MPGLAKSSLRMRSRRRGKHAHLQPHAARYASRLASTSQLMPPGTGLLLPRLDGIPLIHRLVADDRLAVMLAEALVDLDIAVAGDWNKAGNDPTSYVRLTLDRWIRTQGGPAIRRRFLLSALISNTPSDWAEPDHSQPNRLFLIVEPSEATCGCVNFGPTLQSLESVHPQLPATFFHLFVGALNAWLRVYDFRDAEDRVEMLREWAAQEPNADEYEIPDVEGSIPPCMKQEPLDDAGLTRLKEQITDQLALKLIDGVIALDHVSAQAKHPELDDNIRERLSDCNPPLPCLLALFADADAISACFDEEAQGMLEVEPEPNIIIPFDPTDSQSVRQAFHAFGVACQTIAAASKLIDLMPGNDQWIIARAER
jgi:hypothetical protein